MLLVHGREKIFVNRHTGTDLVAFPSYLERAVGTTHKTFKRRTLFPRCGSRGSAVSSCSALSYTVLRKWRGGGGRIADGDS